MAILSCLSFLFPLDILAVKFDSKLTSKDQVRGIVSRVSPRISILRLVKCVFVTLLCYFVATMYLLSQSWSIVLRSGGLLLNVIFHGVIKSKFIAKVKIV